MGGERSTAQRIAPGALTALLREVVRAPAPEPAEEVPPLEPGDRVGRYEIVRAIGRGGFGIVYEARDPALGRNVALKKVRLDAARPSAAGLLLREAEAAAQLSHPHVVTLHDVGSDARGPYLVMELLHGETLAGRLRRGTPPLGDALRIALAVAHAVAHAHAHGVLHRDLSPANVFLCDDGGVKVLDFGMAQAFGRRSPEGGTLPFMAPEQRRGAPEDERSDVYALGVILHLMLSGEVPPRAGAALALEAAPSLGGLVTRMLAADPVQRPRDGAAVASALDAVQAEVLGSGAAGTRPRARLRPHRRRLAAALGAMAALVAVLAAAAWVRRPALAGPPSVAVLPFADLSPAGDQGYLADGVAEEILNALAHVDGLRVAGRTSSFAFRGRSGDLRTIGAQLGVATVLEGSVRRADRRIRVTAQLVGVGDGYHLWSETFERELTDAFALQDEIAAAVAAALKVRLLPGPQAVPERPRSISAEAYEQVLVARQQFALLTPDGFRGAVAASERAVAVEPRWAQGWASLAKAISNAIGFAEDPAASAALERRGLEAAERAVTLDPTLADARVARSAYRVTRWDWRGAREDLEAALALAPGDTGVQRNLGLLLAALGRREEALQLTRRVTELDPLFAVNWHTLGGQYLATGQLELARNAYRRALELAPRMATAHLLLAMGLLLDGKPAAAMAEAEREPVEPLRLVVAAMARHDLGDADGSRRALDGFRAAAGGSAPFTEAVVRAWRGELDAALRLLEQARDRHDPELGDLRAKEWMLPRLRREPRYALLVRSLGLPEDGAGERPATRGR